MNQVYTNHNSPERLMLPKYLTEGQQSYPSIITGVDLKVIGICKKFYNEFADWEEFDSQQNIRAGSSADLKEITGDNPGVIVSELGTLQTIAISIRRGKPRVRGIGKSGPCARGWRTIAGSMVFAELHEDSLINFLRFATRGDETYADVKDLMYVSLDQIPPMTVIMTYQNEYGRICREVLFGVEFAAEGKTVSVHDLYVEKVVQFLAAEKTPLEQIANVPFQNNWKERLETYDSLANKNKRTLAFFKKWSRVGV